MKTKILAGLVALGASSSAFAAYKKMAECTGVTDRGYASTSVLYVNPNADTTGLVLTGLQGQAPIVSDTTVEWTPQGYPRFFDNDFDLDIVITDSAPSADDILFEDHYVSQMTCVFTP